MHKDQEPTAYPSPLALTTAIRCGRVIDVISMLDPDDPLLTPLAIDDLRDAEGATMLSLAIMHGHYPIVALLLNHGCDVDACDQQGKSALMTAVRCGRMDMVELLLLHQAKIHLCDLQGSNALLEAASQGHIRMVARLISAGADVLHQDDQHRHLLSIAASRQWLQCIEQVPGYDFHGKTLAEKIALIFTDATVIDTIHDHEAGVLTPDTTMTLPMP